jgi:GNAT superfamily N-acetyltransferase
MNIKFTSPFEPKPGTIAELLRRSYAELVSSEPELWRPEITKWDGFDKEVFQYSDTVGAGVFLTWCDNQLVGFASYDPRQKPEVGIVGHNCIVPEFRRRGLGKAQLLNILRHFQSMSIKTAKVSTNSHPFFIPAQRMYVACGFIEKRRYPWDIDPSSEMIEYEKEIG